MSIFVASPVDVYHDGEADARLAETNDARFASTRGILRVDEPRWQQAQDYERDTWMVYNRDTATDRNELHSTGFGGYAVLPTELGNYIELGCGPFTNTRFILPGRHVTSLTLLDPLLNDYATHPHCTYQGWTMQGYPVTPLAMAIEAWKLDTTYDTLVMTNVLPHCYDALAVFETVRRALTPGGWFVFHEDPRPIDPQKHYDVGHPLAVTQPVIDEFLADFPVVYRQGNYFIGRKPSTLAAAKGKTWHKK